MDTIPFEITALLGTVDIPMKAYIGLQIGDILVLDQKIEDGLQVRVGEQTHYLVTAGLYETHKAILIDERIYP